MKTPERRDAASTMKNQGICKSRQRSGQAMAEMVVAMVVIMVIVTGLLHIARLAMAHTEAMHEARRQAGEYAMQESPTISDASFIRDWEEGADGTRYSRDDISLEAAASDFTTIIPNVAQPDQLEGFLPENPVSSMAAHPSPQNLFNMVRGDAVRYVDPAPVFRNLIYAADSIDLVGEVWMIHTRGIR